MPRECWKLIHSELSSISSITILIMYYQFPILSWHPLVIFLVELHRAHNELRRVRDTGHAPQAQRADAEGGCRLQRDHPTDGAQEGARRRQSAVKYQHRRHKEVCQWCRSRFFNRRWSDRRTTTERLRQADGRRRQLVDDASLTELGLYLLSFNFSL